MAGETSEGSKNFNAPASTPNYFSNEAGPLQGPASETQRGQLYMQQTYGTPRPAAVAESPRGRQHVAMAEPRGRLIRGRAAYGRRAAVRGHPVYHAVARGRSGARVEHVAARSHPIVHKPTRVSANHHRARG